MLVFDDSDRLLLQLRTDNHRWGIPGGSLEIGERIENAAVREVYEETGYEVRATGLAGIFTEPENVITYPNGDRVRFLTVLYRGRVVGGDPTEGNEETLEVGWYAIDDLPDNLGPVSRRFLRAYIENGRTPLLR